MLLYDFLQHTAWQKVPRKATQRGLLQVCMAFMIWATHVLQRQIQTVAILQNKANHIKPAVVRIFLCNSRR